MTQRGPQPLCQLVFLIPRDAGCGDLRGDTSGHGPIITDAHAFIAGKAVRIVCMHNDLLICSAVTNQHLIEISVQNASDHYGISIVTSFQFQNNYLQYEAVLHCIWSKNF